MARTETMDAAPTLDDVTCPICLSLFLEPVTLPCHHSLCLPCFQEHVSLTSLACPLCRTRISIWVRKNTKTNTLVNAKLWKAIQKYFPAKLEARLAGQEDSSGFTQGVQQRVSQPGEIRQEYESFLQQETQEAAQRKNKEETASIQLIQQLQEEEKKRKQEVEQQQDTVAQKDFLLALQLEETDKAQIDLQQKKLQELCARDEDLARRLEVVEVRSPQAPPGSKGASGSRSVSASPRGPMDLFLNQKSVSRPHQSPHSVLSSSDINSMLSQDTSTPPSLREPAIKRYSSHSSESESDEPSPRRHVHSAPGKENVSGRWRGNHVQQGEGSRGKQQGHSSAYRELQLSPDIDSYCVSTNTANHQRGCGSSWEITCPEVEKEVVAKEEKTKCGNVNGCSMDPPEDVLLLKWDKDKESLAALLAEQQRAEAQLQQELQDRLLAEALQEELNNQAKKVLRTKGSEDEYALRHRKKTIPYQNQAGPSTGSNTKRQATLSEVLCNKRHKSA